MTLCVAGRFARKLFLFKPDAYQASIGADSARQQDHSPPCCTTCVKLVFAPSLLRPLKR